MLSAAPLLPKGSPQQTDVTFATNFTPDAFPNLCLLLVLKPLKFLVSRTFLNHYSRDPLLFHSCTVCETIPILTSNGIQPSIKILCYFVKKKMFTAFIGIIMRRQLTAVVIGFAVVLIYFFTFSFVLVPHWFITVYETKQATLCMCVMLGQIINKWSP